jgi:hypothetical protein
MRLSSVRGLLSCVGLVAASLGSSVAHADDPSFDPFPKVILQALAGPAVGEEKSPFTFFVSLEAGFLHPVWIDVRARLMNTYEKIDLLAGVVVSHSYGSGNESYNITDSQTSSLTTTTTKYHSESQDATVRDYWIVAGGVRAVAAVDSVQPGDTAKSSATYPMAIAGLQIHHDSDLGAHKILELYATLRPGGGPGFLGCVHTSFNALPRIQVGTEIGYSKLHDNISDFYLTLDIGTSFGH